LCPGLVATFWGLNFQARVIYEKRWSLVDDERVPAAVSLYWRDVRFKIAMHAITLSTSRSTWWIFLKTGFNCVIGFICWSSVSRAVVLYFLI
jgi:hypothetical protein